MSFLLLQILYLLSIDTKQRKETLTPVPEILIIRVITRPDESLLPNQVRQAANRKVRQGNYRRSASFNFCTSKNTSCR